MSKPKFSVGEEVRIPGTRIRSPRYQNQFAYDKTGLIEAMRWSKPTKKRVKVAGSRREITNSHGLTYVDYDYEFVEFRIPVYKINGIWHLEDGIKKL